MITEHQFNHILARAIEREGLDRMTGELLRLWAQDWRDDWLREPEWSVAKVTRMVTASARAHKAERPDTNRR